MTDRVPGGSIGDMPYGPETRASDDDREKIASRLRDAHAEGRLSIDEFQSRLDGVYTARTYGELEPLVRDIPIMRATATAAPAVPAATGGSHPVRKRSGGDKAMAVAWSVWGSVVAINLVVWLLVSVTSAEAAYFWPIWVAGPWGAVLLSVEVVRRRF